MKLPEHPLILVAEGIAQVKALAVLLACDKINPAEFDRLTDTFPKAADCMSDLSRESARRWMLACCRRAIELLENPLDTASERG